MSRDKENKEETPGPRPATWTARVMRRFASKRDLANESDRKEANHEAIEDYLQNSKAGMPPPQLHEPLDELATIYRGEGIPVSPLYQEAYLANRNDTILLRLLVAEYEEELGDAEAPPRAMEAFWALAAAEPTDFRHYQRLLNRYLATGDDTSAIRVCEQVINRWHSISDKYGTASNLPHANRGIVEEAYDLLSAVYVEMERVDELAVEVYKRRLKFEPSDVKALEMIARHYMDQGRIDQEALTIYEQYFVCDPQNTALQSALMESYFANGVSEHGIALLESLQMQSSDIRLLRRLIQHYREQRIFTPATIDRLKRYAAAHSDDPELAQYVADYYALRHDTGMEAAHFFRRALGDPTHDQVYRKLLASHYAEEHNWEELLKVLEPLRDRNQLSGDALLAYATGHSMLQHKAQEHISIYEKAIAEGSRSEVIFDMLSICYVLDQQFDDRAFRHFEATIQLHPDTMWAYLGLAAYYLKLDEPQNALVFALRHLENNPTDKMGRHLVGFSMARSLEGDPVEVLARFSDEETIDILSAATETTPDDGRLLIPLAHLYIKGEKGNAKDRRRVFKGLADLYPNDVLVYEQWRLAALEEGAEDEAQEAERHLAFLASQRDLESEFASDPRQLLSLVREALGRQAELTLEKKLFDADDEELLRLATREGVATSEVYRRLALHAADKNDLGAEVVDLYERAVLDNPELLALRHLLMQSLILVGARKRVFEYATDMLLRRPYDKLTLSLVAECLMYEKAYDPDLHDLVRTQYEMRMKDPGTTLAYALFNLRAETYSREAAVVYERAIEFASDDQRLVLSTGLARCLEEIGDTEKAVQVYETIIGDIPTNVQILRRLAHNFFHGSDQTTNLEEDVLIKSLNESDYDTDLYLELCGLFINRHVPRLTQFLIDRVFNNDPKAIDRLIPLLEKARRLGQAGPFLTIQLAEYHYLNGDRDRALRLMNELDNLTKRQAEAAIEFYNIVLVKNGDDLEVRKRRGHLLLQVGSLLPAIEDLILYWDNEKTRRPLAPEFIELINRFLAESTSVHPTLLMMLAESFYMAGRYEETERLARIILRRMPRDEKSALLLARSMLQQGRLLHARVAVRGLPRTRNVLDFLYRLACAFELEDQEDTALLILNEIRIYEPEWRDTPERVYRLERRRLVIERPRKQIERMRRLIPPQHRLRFEPVSELGRTPIYRLIKAYDREKDRLVCLKLLGPGLTQREIVRYTFLTSMAAGEKVDDPGVLRLHEKIDEGDEGCLGVFEHAEGGSMRRYLSNGRKTIEGSLKLLSRVAETLHRAHSQYIIHGDLTPSDIYLDDIGAAKLGNFGRVTLYADTSIVTPQIKLARPYYRAPECFGGEPTASADAYSLGVILYEIFAGKPPFTYGRLEERHLYENPAPLENVPDEINNLIFSLLSKDPTERPANLHIVSRDLIHLAESCSNN